MKKFPFDLSFQRAVLRLCMIDDVFCQRCMEHLEPAHFTTKAHGWIFAAMRQHFQDYAQRCTDMPLRNLCRTTPSADPYQPEVEEVIRLGYVAEAEYVKANLQQFIHEVVFALANHEAVLAWNAGDTKKSLRITREGVEKIQSISFENVNRSWFFDSIQKRQSDNFLKKQDPTKGVYPTYWDPLDKLFRGGIHSGEVFAVLGDAKSGKSTFLVNQACRNAYVTRVPTLIINLEGKREQWEDRMDSCITQEHYDRVRLGEFSTETWKAMMEDYERLRGLCVIRSFSEDWDASILHIDAELKALRAEGFVPEVIVLDYADLLRSRHNRSSETEQQIDSMKDIKRLANSGYAIWTACQVRRPTGSKRRESTLIRAKDIADAYGKIRIVDGYGSLNVTDEERANGECRLFWEGYRDGPVHRVFKMKHNLDCLRMGVEFDEHNNLDDA